MSKENSHRLINTPIIHGRTGYSWSQVGSLRKYFVFKNEFYNTFINTTILQMDKELLPIYEQAADLQGVNMKIIASEGESFFFRNKNISVLNSNVAISLTREVTENGLTDFYKTVEMIKAELPNTRIG